MQGHKVHKEPRSPRRAIDHFPRGINVKLQPAIAYCLLPTAYLSRLLSFAYCLLVFLPCVSLLPACPRHYLVSLAGLPGFVNPFYSFLTVRSLLPTAFCPLPTCPLPRLPGRSTGFRKSFLQFSYRAFIIAYCLLPTAYLSRLLPFAYCLLVPRHYLVSLAGLPGSVNPFFNRSLISTIARSS